MNNELRQQIKEEVFKEIIENSYIKVVGRIEKGILSIRNNTEIMVNNEVIQFIPYDVRINDEKIILNGNLRNSLAKEFIQEVEYKTIREYFLKKVEEKEKHNKLEEENKYKLEEVFNKYVEGKFKDFELWYNHINNKHYFNFSVYRKGCSKEYEVYNNNELNKFSVRDFSKNEVVEENYTKEELINFIEEKRKEYEEIKRKEEEEYQRIKNAKLLRLDLEDKIEELINNNEYVILISKNSFITLQYNIKFSIGSGKSGKYSKITNKNIEKFIDEIIEGKIKGYYAIKTEEERKNINFYDTQFLKNLEYKKFI